jgi:hypothetical protein
VSANQYRPTLARALILSPDPVVGALLGAMVELGGLEPVFPSTSETPRDTLRATRTAVLLIDCDHPGAQDDTLLGNAMMIGARTFLVGTAESIAALAESAGRYELRTLVMPRDAGRLPGLLFTEGTESTRRPPQSTAP